MCVALRLRNLSEKAAVYSSTPEVEIIETQIPKISFPLSILSAINGRDPLCSERCLR